MVVKEESKNDGIYSLFRLIFLVFIPRKLVFAQKDTVATIEEACLYV